MTGYFPCPPLYQLLLANALISEVRHGLTEYLHERQMKALTGLSQAQFDSLLPIFSDIARATQQQTYEEGLQSGTRRRRPGGGAKGKLPTMVEKLQFVLYYYKT